MFARHAWCSTNVASAAEMARFMLFLGKASRDLEREASTLEVAA